VCLRNTCLALNSGADSRWPLRTGELVLYGDDWDSLVQVDCGIIWQLLKTLERDTLVDSWR